MHELLRFKTAIDSEKKSLYIPYMLSITLGVLFVGIVFVLEYRMIRIYFLILAVVFVFELLLFQFLFSVNNVKVISKGTTLFLRETTNGNCDINDGIKSYVYRWTYNWNKGVSKDSFDDYDYMVEEDRYGLKETSGPNEIWLYLTLNLEGGGVSMLKQELLPWEDLPKNVIYSDERSLAMYREAGNLNKLVDLLRSFGVDSF